MLVKLDDFLLLLFEGLQVSLVGLLARWCVGSQTFVRLVWVMTLVLFLGVNSISFLSLWCLALGLLVVAQIARRKG